MYKYIYHVVCIWRQTWFQRFQSSWRSSPSSKPSPFPRTGASYILYIYIYIYIYIYVYICIYRNTYIYIYVYINVYVCLYIYKSICINTYISRCLHLEANLISTLPIELAQFTKLETLSVSEIDLRFASGLPLGCISRCRVPEQSRFAGCSRVINIEKIARW